VKPYLVNANLFPLVQGLVAVDAKAMDDLPKIKKAMEACVKTHKPTYT